MRNGAGTRWQARRRANRRAKLKHHQLVSIALHFKWAPGTHTSCSSLPLQLLWSLQILDVWIFGDVWCRGWLVTDVWISTASILNLCAISVDRYVAVTRPVKYRSIMTPRKAKTIVASVWIVSFLICCPPLLPAWTPSQPSPSDVARPPEVDAGGQVEVSLVAASGRTKRQLDNEQASLSAQASLLVANGSQRQGESCSPLASGSDID